MAAAYRADSVGVRVADAGAVRALGSLALAALLLAGLLVIPTINQLVAHPPLLTRQFMFRRLRPVHYAPGCRPRRRCSRRRSTSGCSRRRSSSCRWSREHHHHHRSRHSTWLAGWLAGASSCRPPHRFGVLDADAAALGAHRLLACHAGGLGGAGLEARGEDALSSPSWQSSSSSPMGDRTAACLPHLAIRPVLRLAGALPLAAGWSVAVVTGLGTSLPDGGNNDTRIRQSAWMEGPASKPIDCLTCVLSLMHSQLPLRHCGTLHSAQLLSHTCRAIGRISTGTQGSQAPPGKPVSHAAAWGGRGGWVATWFSES